MAFDAHNFAVDLLQDVALVTDPAEQPEPNLLLVGRRPWLQGLWGLIPLVGYMLPVPCFDRREATSDEECPSLPDFNSPRMLGPIHCHFSRRPCRCVCDVIPNVLVEIPLTIQDFTRWSVRLNFLYVNGR